MRPHNKIYNQLGFTLVELMIVITIISIVAAISIPTYQSYMNRANIQSCLAETKSYSNSVFYALNDQEDVTLPTAPVTKACQSITDATGWTSLTQSSIVAIPKSSTASIECNVMQSSSCEVVP